MLITCWSVKGGSGTTVVAAALALVAARATPLPLSTRPVPSPSSPTLLVDLAGDVPGVLGLAEPPGPGVVDWLGADADPASLEHLVTEARPRLWVAPRGDGLLPDHPRWAALARYLADRPGTAVVDAGSHGPPPQPLHDAATSVLVIRPCYLALRRAARLGIRPDEVVLVDEPGRALRRPDVESVIGVKVKVHLELDPAIARAVDAGLLAGRLPSPLLHGLRRVA